ncbi:hypothetical protein BDW74DRAFT_179155 [Aspergillus multicolor]|uniref:uncharacterized protein n=1 Tax=Aspergillus multicolor TaxID=41759 RepID=UPI003CCDB9AC
MSTTSSPSPPPSPIILPHRASRANRRVISNTVASQTATSLAPVPRQRRLPNPNNRIFFILVSMERNEAAPHQWTLAFTPTNLENTNTRELLHIHNPNSYVPTRGLPLTITSQTVTSSTTYSEDAYSSAHWICEYPRAAHDELTTLIRRCVEIGGADASYWHTRLLSKLREWRWIKWRQARVLQSVLCLRGESDFLQRRVAGVRRGVWSSLYWTRLIGTRRAEDLRRQRREEHDMMVAFGEIGSRDLGLRRTRNSIAPATGIRPATLPGHYGPDHREPGQLEYETAQERERGGESAMDMEDEVEMPFSVEEMEEFERIGRIVSARARELGVRPSQLREEDLPEIDFDENIPRPGEFDDITQLDEAGVFGSDGDDDDDDEYDEEDGLFDDETLTDVDIANMIHMGGLPPNFHYSPHSPRTPREDDFPDSGYSPRSPTPGRH